ncbi:MAG: DUF4382 domain-containing protein [Gemmatimonadota bacterium]|nr:DUF4382 domain-containing protein [Gemmatimonadota bacterium]MDH3368594.1 DUF4382 domain-containing protein [Gemmatimonadota bacterium]MDH3477393.1 DUF4382 domain-containing protein [Gemmatimonadota bacterium]MDH3570412.1 DUF4382 domain-containing protein [Gemmatimonadota bacterium]MDH5548764.1 DUF4382 domain-containing protein [Gemmatimonadota bacterium]
MTRKILGLAMAGAMAVGAGACADSAGLDHTGSVEVTMSQSAVPLVQIVDGLALSGLDAEGKVSPSQVDSLLIEVTSISFLADSSDVATDPDAEECCGYWIHLGLTDAVWIDLANLPDETTNPLIIAAGEVPVGMYRKVRLLVGNAYVIFNEPIQVGNAASFEAGVPHEVTVPSGMQTGLKTDTDFEVTADGDGNPTDVNLVFDPSSTYNNLHGTGSGKVMLSPVFRMR